MEFNDKKAIAEDSAKIVKNALISGVPIVLIMGQASGWPHNIDPVLDLALKKKGQNGSNWSELLSREPLENDFYQWMAERFQRRTPSPELTAIGDFPVSAVYTSSIDPGISNLFATEGRQPEPILAGNPVPSQLRSTIRPPIFYLFGRAGAGSAELTPPVDRQKKSVRRLNHSSPMLSNLGESATALGLIIIDGYVPGSDWLPADDLLAAISIAPKRSVIWFGADPVFDVENSDLFETLIENGIVVRDEQTLAEAYVYLQASGEVPPKEISNAPGLIALPNGSNFVVSPQLRLLTETTASIIDNSWLDFIAPFSMELEFAAFQSFHSAIIGTRALVEGIRRNYAFERDFEANLYSIVEKALARHHDQNGAIILHGQSGVGKTIALCRLVVRLRTRAKSVVLIASGPRVPQASDVAPFLEAIGKSDTVTLLIVDANAVVSRYNELLTALRSGGQKVVLVGTTYKLDLIKNKHILVPAELSKNEQKSLIALSLRYRSENELVDVNSEYALAKFYWSLPESRTGMADGLSREARMLETSLQVKGQKLRPVKSLGALGVALISAGYAHSQESLFADNPQNTDFLLNSPGAKIIDYVMAVSRLHKSVPINLLIRTVISGDETHKNAVDVETLRDLFDGHSFFKWTYSGRDKNEILVSSRLQIEAELVCQRRFGTARLEALAVLELLKNAQRAGFDESEEAHFATDIVYALGPDGDLGDRYKDSYLDIAACLTSLRVKSGVMNARLILQESALRRAYLRTHDLQKEEKSLILEEAVRAVDIALQSIELTGNNRLYAARRTKEYLHTERAAIYGFLATDSAQSEENSSLVWASYRTAREVARRAAGRVGSYQPMDIQLWVPIRVLKISNHLSHLQQAELEADIRSTIDLVDSESLNSEQYVLFNKQKTAAAEVLSDLALEDDAFTALDAAGSPVGYYLRAKRIAPQKPINGEVATPPQIIQAEMAIKYLMSVYPKISNDSRSLNLLLSMKWLQATGRWLFRGLRQPLPHDNEAREQIGRLLTEIRQNEGESFLPKLRYLEAVFQWLGGETAKANQAWRVLARDTEYIEARRVSNRHTITDIHLKPIAFNGHIVKPIGPGRWSISVDGLNREIDLQASDFPANEISLGRLIRGFGISFNYRGAIADPMFGRAY